MGFCITHESRGSPRKSLQRSRRGQQDTKNEDEFVLFSEEADQAIREFLWVDQRDIGSPSSA